MKHAPIVLSPKIKIPSSEFVFDYALASGPGGQNVAKVRTKAVLHWPVATSPSIPDDLRERFLKRYANRVNDEGSVVITGDRFRRQLENREDCLNRLEKLLRSVLEAPIARKKTRPRRRILESRLDEKHLHAEKKKLRAHVRLENPPSVRAKTRKKA